MFAYVKFHGEVDFNIIEGSRIHNFVPPADTQKYYNVDCEGVNRHALIAFVAGMFKNVLDFP